MDDVALRMIDVNVKYGRGSEGVSALSHVSLDVATGSLVAVMGPSGSGKSTLLQCAAGLEHPTCGTVWLGRDLSEMSQTQLTVLRRERVGFVFQDFNLVPALSVRDNVALPLRLAGRRTPRRLVDDRLAQVGLSDKADAMPERLSGGQRQRVAIARALITEPDVVFADEPTGALDVATSRNILRLLRRAVDEWGRTVVIVTHDPIAAHYADHVVFLAEGQLAGVARGWTTAQITNHLLRLRRAS